MPVADEGNPRPVPTRLRVPLPEREFRDVQAARGAGVLWAGVRVACASYGYNHGRDVAEAAPDAVIGSLEELAPLCFGAPRRRPHPIESEGTR